MANVEVEDYHVPELHEKLAENIPCDLEINNFVLELFLRWGGIPASYFIISIIISLTYNIELSGLFGIGLALSIALTVIIRLVSGPGLSAKISYNIWRLWFIAGAIFLISSVVSGLVTT